MVQSHRPSRALRPRAGALLSCAALLAALAAPAAAQRLVPRAEAPDGTAQAPAEARAQAQDAPRLDAVDHAQRTANRAVSGHPRAPELPPVRPDSPRDDLLYADRFPWGQQAATSADATLVTHVIPAGPGGTETPLAEMIEYQLPDLYDEFGPPHPLVIAYHGYGASPQSVAEKSTIDEKCNTRNWVYMAPTGMDDQIFGTALSQQNTRVAIQYMLDNFNVDPDRLYMVGFSMGAGVSANFTAQHRDPDGLMIAALGLVSGTYDWNQTYKQGSTTLQAFMEDPLHFDGSPTTAPFEYKRWAVLHFDPDSYPPVPGQLQVEDSMAVNLGETPVYMTWDTTDYLMQVLGQNPRLVNVLEGLGGTLEWKTVASTFDPDSGQFAPHSWLVLDENDLFDFFEDKVVDRHPAAFRAMLDEDGPVSWSVVTQRLPDVFSTVEASAVAGVAETSNPVLSTINVDNTTEIDVDLSETPIAGDDPIELTAASIDGDGFRLLLHDATCPPVYLLDATLGTLVPETDHDPIDEELEITVSPGTALEADVVCEPDWTTKLWITPKLLGPGDPLALMIDAPAGTTTAWMLAGFAQQLATVKGYHVTVAIAGSLLFPLPLGIEGDLLLQGKLPNDPNLSGLDLYLQVIGADLAGEAVTASNMWIVPIE